MLLTNYSRRYDLVLYWISPDGVLEYRGKLTTGDRHSETVSWTHTWCLVAMSSSSHPTVPDMITGQGSTTVDDRDTDESTFIEDTDAAMLLRSNPADPSTVLLMNLSPSCLAEQDTCSLLWIPGLSLSLSQKRRTTIAHTRPSAYSSKNIIIPHFSIQVLDGKNNPNSMLR